MAFSNYSLLLSSSPSIPISSKFPILSSMIHSRRQHPVVLKGFSCLKEQKGNGCSIHVLQRNSWFGSIRMRCNKGWGSEGEGDFALETEILKSIDCSENPNKFPTKKDLINAGREDLVEAIEKNGDWLSKGWDLDKEEEEEEGIVQENEVLNSGVEEDLGSGFLHSDDRIFQERCFNGGKCDSLEEVDVGSIASEDSSSSSTLGREMEKEEESVEEDDSGIHGSREKESNLSCKNDYYDDEELKLGSSMFSSSKPVSTTSLKPSSDSYIVSEATDFGKGSISDFDDLGDSHKPVTWRTWSSQREGLSQLDFEVDETDIADDLSCKNDYYDDELKLGSSMFSDSRPASMGDSLKPDTWRAWSSQREGLSQLDFEAADIGFDVTVDNFLYNSQLVSSTLRTTTTCIVWHYKAFSVQVSGSFDKWTSKRMMEKSSSGIFILNLKLYPGRYEFKFIVDGVWKIDPLRPIARNNGYENNVIVVYPSDDLGDVATDSWRTIYVNACRKEFNMNMKTINPNFKPDQNEVDESKPVIFYKQTEFFVFNCAQGLAKWLKVMDIKETLKQLVMVLVVVPGVAICSHVYAALVGFGLEKDMKESLTMLKILAFKAFTNSPIGNIFWPQPKDEKDDLNE